MRICCELVFSSGSLFVLVVLFWGRGRLCAWFLVGRNLEGGKLGD